MFSPIRHNYVTKIIIIIKISGMIIFGVIFSKIKNKNYNVSNGVPCKIYVRDRLIL